MTPPTRHVNALVEIDTNDRTLKKRHRFKESVRRRGHDPALQHVCK